MDNIRRESGQDDFAKKIREDLTEFLGEKTATTVLYYTGRPDPSTFENKLRAFFGQGAEPVILRLKT